MSSPVFGSQAFSFSMPPTTPTPSTNQSLPLGSIVGITIGAILLGILAAIALGCLIWRFRAKSNNRPAAPDRIIEVKEEATSDRW